jgi:hypothetical protein
MAFIEHDDDDIDPDIDLHSVYSSDDDNETAHTHNKQHMRRSSSTPLADILRAIERNASTPASLSIAEHLNDAEFDYKAIEDIHFAERLWNQPDDTIQTLRNATQGVTELASLLEGIAGANETYAIQLRHAIERCQASRSNSITSSGRITFSSSLDGVLLSLMDHTGKASDAFKQLKDTLLHSASAIRTQVQQLHTQLDSATPLKELVAGLNKASRAVRQHMKNYATLLKKHKLCSAPEEDADKEDEDLKTNSAGPVPVSAPRPSVFFAATPDNRLFGDTLSVPQMQQQQEYADVIANSRQYLKSGAAELSDSIRTNIEQNEEKLQQLQTEQYCLRNSLHRSVLSMLESAGNSTARHIMSVRAHIVPAIVQSAGAFRSVATLLSKNQLAIAKVNAARDLKTFVSQRDSDVPCPWIAHPHQHPSSSSVQLSATSGAASHSVEPIAHIQTASIDRARTSTSSPVAKTKKLVTLAIPESDTKLSSVSSHSPGSPRHSIYKTLKAAVPLRSPRAARIPVFEINFSSNSHDTNGGQVLPWFPKHAPWDISEQEWQIVCYEQLLLALGFDEIKRPRTPSTAAGRVNIDILSDIVRAQCGLTMDQHIVIVAAMKSTSLLQDVSALQQSSVAFRVTMLEHADPDNFPNMTEYQSFCLRQLAVVAASASWCIVAADIPFFTNVAGRRKLSTDDTGIVLNAVLSSAREELANVVLSNAGSSRSSTLTGFQAAIVKLRQCVCSIWDQVTQLPGTSSAIDSEKQVWPYPYQVVFNMYHTLLSTCIAEVDHEDWSLFDLEVTNVTCGNNPSACDDDTISEASLYNDDRGGSGSGSGGRSNDGDDGDDDGGDDRRQPDAASSVKSLHAFWEDVSSLIGKFGRIYSISDHFHNLCFSRLMLSLIDSHVQVYGKQLSSPLNVPLLRKPIQESSNNSDGKGQSQHPLALLQEAVDELADSVPTAEERSFHNRTVRELVLGITSLCSNCFVASVPNITRALDTLYSVHELEHRRHDHKQSTAGVSQQRQLETNYLWSKKAGYILDQSTVRLWHRMQLLSRTPATDKHADLHSFRSNMPLVRERSLYQDPASLTRPGPPDSAMQWEKLVAIMQYELTNVVGKYLDIFDAISEGPWMQTFLIKLTKLMHESAAVFFQRNPLLSKETTSVLRRVERLNQVVQQAADKARVAKFALQRLPNTLDISDSLIRQWIQKQALTIDKWLVRILKIDTLETPLSVSIPHSTSALDVLTLQDGLIRAFFTFVESIPLSQASVQQVNNMLTEIFTAYAQSIADVCDGLANVSFAKSAQRERFRSRARSKAHSDALNSSQSISIQSLCVRLSCVLFVSSKIDELSELWGILLQQCKHIHTDTNNSDVHDDDATLAATVGDSKELQQQKQQQQQQQQYFIRAKSRLEGIEQTITQAIAHKMIFIEWSSYLDTLYEPSITTNPLHVHLDDMDESMIELYRCFGSSAERIGPHVAAAIFRALSQLLLNRISGQNLSYQQGQELHKDFTEMKDMFAVAMQPQEVAIYAAPIQELLCASGIVP